MIPPVRISQLREKYPLRRHIDTSPFNEITSLLNHEIEEAYANGLDYCIVTIPLYSPVTGMVFDTQQVMRHIGVTFSKLYDMRVDMNHLGQMRVTIDWGGK